MSRWGEEPTIVSVLTRIADALDLMVEAKRARATAERVGHARQVTQSWSQYSSRLSPRTIARMKANNMSVDDAQRAPDEELLGMRFFGPKLLRELRQVLPFAERPDD